MSNPTTTGGAALRRNAPLEPEAWQALCAHDDSTVVEAGDAEAALVLEDGRLRLYLGFASVEALKRAFPPMWELLRPELAVYEQDAVCCDLVAMPNRRWAQELLEEADFVLSGEWVELEHHDLRSVAPPDFDPDLSMRRSEPDDAARILEIAGAIAEQVGAFASGARARDLDLSTVGWGGVLVRDGRVVAFALNSDAERGGGIGRVLAHGADPEAEDHEALASQVLAAATYQLASQGARLARVRASFEEGAAIAAAREAGYDPGTRGIEFLRPNDEDEIARRRHQKHVDGMKVRFGSWR